MRPLTPKQQRFVEEYLVDLNATAAYRRAGYTAKGRAAENNASRLLGNAGVAAAIAAGKLARSNRTQVTADQVVRELARIAFLDPRELMSWGGDGGVAFKASDELGEDVARCVSECSETVTEGGGTVRVKVANKLTALELLGKHLGMFTDRHQVDVSGTVAQVHFVLPKKDEHP